MGNKTTIIGMSAIFLICMGYWFFLVHYVYPKHPEWNFNGTTQQNSQNSAVNPSTEASTSTAPTTAPSLIAATGIAATPEAVATTQEISSGPTTRATMQQSLASAAGNAGGTASIGSDAPDDPNYALGMRVDPAGAAISAVTINSYKNDDANGRYVYQQPNEDYHLKSMSTQAIVIDGQSLDLSETPWQLESKAVGGSATFEIDLLSVDHKPLLHIDKTFEVAERGPKKNRQNTAAGYEAVITYHLKNLSGRALKSVVIQTEGPLMPPREMERFDDRQIVSGYDKGDNNNVDVNRDGLSSFKLETADKDVSTHSGYKFLWSGMMSNYFAAVVLPDKEGQVDWVHEICQNPTAPSDERVAALEMKSAALSLGAGATADLPMRVFFGPKERDLVEGEYYGQFPRRYDQLLASSSSFCGICALPWLVDRLVDLLWLFHAVLRDWGLAIIALVVLVRAILHPISKSSQVSMLSLQKMGPELEKLKKKYGDDKEALSKAQMEMHKEMGIAPFLGCLPMFLQMPIWIALYSALQNDISLRQAPFLWGMTWIHDLARPDRLFTWPNHAFTLPLLGMKVVSLNILPLAVAVVMFLQQKLTPQPPTLTPEQASQQKMMRYMSLLMSLFFYWMPSGLNLYILTSSTIAIFESKIIRDHIEKKKAEEKSGKVIVDAKPTRAGKQKSKQEPKAQASNAGCLGLGSVWANLQAKAEEVQREAERRPKKRG